MKLIYRCAAIISALMSAAVLALLGMDLFRPELDLFLDGRVKAFLLAAGLAAAVSGGLLAARDRKQARRAHRRRAKRRMSA